MLWTHTHTHTHTPPPPPPPHTHSNSEHTGDAENNNNRLRNPVHPLILAKSFIVHVIMKLFSFPQSDLKPITQLNLTHHFHVSLAIQNAQSEDADRTVHCAPSEDSDLNLRWAHMSDGTFSDFTASLYLYLLNS